MLASWRACLYVNEGCCLLCCLCNECMLVPHRSALLRPTEYGPKILLLISHPWQHNMHSGHSNPCFSVSFCVIAVAHLQMYLPTTKAIYLRFMACSRPGFLGPRRGQLLQLSPQCSSTLTIGLLMADYWSPHCWISHTCWLALEMYSPVLQCVSRPSLRIAAACLMSCLVLCLAKD